MIRVSAAKTLDAAEAVALTTHRSSVGTDHADVATNTSAISTGKGPGVTTVEDTGAIVGGPTTINAFIAPAAGTILAVYAKLGTGCAAGQTVDVDVQIAGVTALTGAAQLDNGDGTTAIAGSVDAAADDFTAGQLITVLNTEANGGGPTASDLTVTVAWRLT